MSAPSPSPTDPPPAMNFCPTPTRPLAPLTAIIIGAIAPLSIVHANTLYWNAASGSSWATAANWSTDAAGATPSAFAPTSADNLIFNSSPFNSTANQVVTSADIAASSLTFAGTSTMRVSQTNTTKALTLGSGGITVNNGMTGVTIGESTGSLFTDASANQTWANNSTGGLTVRRLRASNSASGNVAVTLSANSSGSIGFNNSIEDSLDGTKKLSIIIDSSGTGTVTLLASTWSGGTTVKRGVLSTSSAAIGASDVTLGDTSGSNNATLRINTTSAVTTNLVSQSGNTGINTLEFITATSGIYGGNIALNGDLTVGVRSVTGGSAINGVISGAGNLIKGQYQGSNSTGLLTLGGINTYSGNTVVNVGSFTLADNAALTFYIGGNGVNNQVKGAGTNVATFDGDFIFNLTSANLTNGNSWTIVDGGSLNKSFSATFLVQGFTESNNVWTNGSGFSFSEATGILSYSAVPEPSTFALLGGAAVLLLAAARRRRTAP